MDEIINVIKATGEIEPFSGEKVIHSLIRAGADELLAQRIVDKIKPHLYQNIPTFQIYSSVMDILRNEKEDLLSKYSLKKAIMDLGPTGYPFEKYIAGILTASGYQGVEVNQIVQGKCVSHEIDIIGQNSQKYMIECKFHGIAGGRTDIKVALYTYARFLDIKHQGFDIPWLITNTKVTQEVKAYALCVGMRVTAWDYPEGESLNEMIDKSGLYPITAVLKLSEEEKKSFLEKGIVFAKDLTSNPN